MLFKLIENRFIEKTTVTIECKVKDKQVEQLIDFIENLDDFENGLTVRLNGAILSITTTGNSLYRSRRQKNLLLYLR